MATNQIGSGQTYTTIAAWATAVKAIGTLTENEVGELVDDAVYTYGASSDLNFSGVTLSGYTITLRGSGSGVHDGTFGTGARVVASASFGGVYKATQVNIEDFSVHNTSTSGGARCFDGTANAILTRVLAKTDSTASNSQPFQLAVGSELYASLAVGGQDGVEIIHASVPMDNVTIVNATNGVQTTVTHTGTIRNVAVYNCTTDFTGTFSGTYSYLADEDSTKPSGTGNVTLTADPFVNSGTGDYTPSTSGQLDGAGTNVSISLDAANKSFSNPPSIGGYEIAADTTAPVLSSPTATTTGSTTADGTVATDENNGTLYWYVSTSATPPSIANHKDGTSSTAFGNQAVT